MSENAPTLSEVAAHAGVSLATASRALNGSARKVNPELQERVLASAQALGYSPNVQAQAVARGTSNVVALVVGDIADPYFSSIASGVVRVADERGLVVTITATGPYAGEATVARETFEEVGVEVKALRHAFDTFASPGSLTELISCFIGTYDAASRTAPGGGLMHEGEDIEIVEIGLNEALAMIRDGRIIDAKTIALLQYLALERPGCDKE